MAMMTKQQGEQVQVSFRVPDQIKQVCNSICKHHGVTLSDFLRAQCILLAKDYGALTTEDH